MFPLLTPNSHQRTPHKGPSGMIIIPCGSLSRVLDPTFKAAQWVAMGNKVSIFVIRFL